MGALLAEGCVVLRSAGRMDALAKGRASGWAAKLLGINALWMKHLDDCWPVKGKGDRFADALVCQRLLLPN